MGLSLPTTTQPASTTASKPKLELAMEQPKLELVAEPEPEERPTDVDGERQVRRK